MIEFSWEESGNVHQDLSKFHLWIESFLGMWHERLANNKGDLIIDFFHRWIYGR
jgi:hypothetical protein